MCVCMFSFSFSFFLFSIELANWLINKKRSVVERVRVFCVRCLVYCPCRVRFCCMSTVASPCLLHFLSRQEKLKSGELHEKSLGSCPATTVVEVENQQETKRHPPQYAWSSASSASRQQQNPSSSIPSHVGVPCSALSCPVLRCLVLSLCRDLSCSSPRLT